ncbi:MAG: hypothetical protein GX117_13540 [Candidatus Hydrogenedentes bacterium]|jgi:hypothetical protein|nr:hypothetical protein [Candidatus Hydrogenedentota bacterium]
MSRGRKGYIFVETVVAMALLSVSAIVIQSALRQGMLTRRQGQDYTIARFLLQQVTGDQALRFQQPEGSGSGRFDAPYDDFRFKWDLKKVSIPRPQNIHALPPELYQSFEDRIVDYMGKLTVRIEWRRGGVPMETVGETLLRPDLFWLPKEER